MALDPAAPDLAESSSPPLPSPRLSPPAAPFFFGGSPAPDLPPLGPQPAAGESLPASPVDGDGWVSGPELTGDPSSRDDDEHPTSTGSPAGTERPRPGPAIGKAAARATGAKAVLIGSSMLHRMATRADTLQRQVGLYLADEEDAANIGHPLADMVSRRGGVAGKALSPDANDAINAALGLAGFMSKQIALQLSIAEHERATAENTVQEFGG